jgi:hypothetical protein
MEMAALNELDEAKAGGISYGRARTLYVSDDILSIGLERLHQIFTKGPNEAAELLAPVVKSPPLRCLPIPQAFDQVASAITRDRWWQRISRPGFSEPCFFSDPDPGPAEAWVWGYRQDQDASSAFYEGRYNKRFWGYVMWDRSRLEKLGVFEREEPFEENIIGMDPPELKMKNRVLLEILRLPLS